ncbi:hypothetical protein Mithridates_00153 [Acinetobacter phage Mithridates]|nr:hypothetical protein Mithridates_00153 [Acinetobacter phage Mithridates]
MAARDYEEYPLTVGDKVEILLLGGIDADLKIKVGDVAKVVLIENGDVYCYNPCWDFREGDNSMRYMMYRQMRKLNKC